MRTGPIYRKLEASGGRAVAETVLLRGIPVQCIPAYNPLVEEAVREAIDTSFEGAPTRVLTDRKNKVLFRVPGPVSGAR